MTKPIRLSFVFRGNALGNVGGAERSMLRLMQYAHPEKIECHVIFFKKNNLPFRSLLLSAGIPVVIVDGALGLYKHLRIINPDVVYLFARPHLILWGLIARKAKVPVIIAAERGSADTILDRIIQNLSKYFMDAYIANSKSASARLRESNISSDRIFVVYNGINEDRTPHLDIINETSLGNPLIVCIASIKREKGQIVLLEAVNNLRIRFPKIRVLLVGRDFTRHKFFEDAEKKGFNDTYLWVDYVKDVRGYLSAADIFVLPSVGGEGMPTSILEAMFLKIPVIATNKGGVNELIHDMKTGLIVEAGNSLILSNAIEKILLDQDLAQRLTHDAYNYVISHHTVSKMVLNHLNIFTHLVALQRQKAK